MANVETKTQEKTKAPTVILKASCELWTEFEEWMRVQGCQTLPEGLRAAMRQVTNFNGQSQQQSS